jgi:diguanylate cyclase (GGDEF)-like protein/PAS domain S-box-containing protein
MRFDIYDRRPIWITFAAVATYVLLFFLLYPSLKEAGAALAILPVVVISWLGGARAGLLAGVLSFPLNTLLLNIVVLRANPWGIVIESGGGPESLAIVLIGFAVGFLRDQNVIRTNELSQYRNAELALIESEERYRTLFESSQRQAQELELLGRVWQALAQDTELSFIFQAVVEGIAHTFGYTQVSLYLVEGEVLRLQHQVGYDQVIEYIPMTQGVAGQVVRTQEPVFLEDVRNDPSFLGAIEGIISEVCVPLFDQNQVVGILNVESIHGVKLSEADLRLMTSLGSQLGVALGRARLYSDVRESEQRFRQLAEHIEQVFWLEDPEYSQMFYVSPAYETIWGQTCRSLYEQPKSWLDSIHPDDQERLRAAQIRKNSGDYDIEYRVLRPDGSLRWVWARAFPIRDQNGQVYRIAGIAEDITMRKAAEETLLQSEERFKLMAWATKDAVWDWDLRTNRIWWGEGLQKIFNYSSELAQTDPAWWFEHIHPDEKAKVRSTIEQALDMGMEFWSKEYRFQRKDGTYADILDRGYILRDTMNKPYRMIGAMIDITERKYMESMLLQANEQMRQFLNELQRRNTEVALLNEMSRLLQSCQSSEEAYGVIGDLSKQLFPRTSGALYILNESRTLGRAMVTWGQLTSVKQILSPNECWALYNGQTHLGNENELDLPCPHLPEPLPAVSYCLPMRVQGETLGVLHVRTQQEENLDEAKQQLAYAVVEHTGMALSNLNLRNALREQSIRDPLTGLYNRRYMEEALKQQLSRVTRHLHPLAIIMIDIDHFKDFNDKYGHAAGDVLLRELGRLLQSHVRGEDIACRYGGEEFILIMPDVSQEIAQHRAERLCRDVRQFQLQDGEQSYSGITLSLGVALYPLHGRNMETVLRAADFALYKAKQQGRNQVIVADRST